MAVTICEKQGRSGKLRREGNTLTNDYIAISDNLDDTIVDIQAAGPDISDQYNVDGIPLNVFCTGFDVDERSRSETPDGKTMYDCKATWSTREPVAKDPNPLSRPAVIIPRGERREMPVTEDALGAPITTTAGEPFTDINEPFPTVVYQVFKNLADDPSWLVLYEGMRNLDAVTLRGLTWPPNTLEVRNYQGSDQKRENQTDFYIAQYELVGNPDGYHRVLLNKGFLERYYWDADNKEITDVTLIQEAIDNARWGTREILDANGKPVTKPQWVDYWGRYIRQPSLGLRQGTITFSTSFSFTVTGITLDANLDLGKYIWIDGAGPSGRSMKNTIGSITSPTTGQVSEGVYTVGTGLDARMHGDFIGRVWNTSRLLNFNGVLPLT
jgi:hypothetical protein